MLDLKKKILDGSVPLDILSAIATLTFPLPPEQILALFPVVYQKGDAGIQEAISRSLAGIPADVLSDFLVHTTDTDAISFYFKILLNGVVEHRDRFYLDILRNPACTSEILEELAALSSDTVINYLLNNHALLQSNPMVFQALSQNAALSPAQSRRLSEYLKFGLVGDKSTAPAAEVSEESSGTASGTEVVEGVEAEELSSVPLTPAVLDLVSEEAPDVLNAPSEIEIEDDMDLNTYQRLLKMNVSQKIKRALMGNKEERAILIRDSNRVVALSVMESPKLTEQEAETISAMRNVHRDVLRKVATNRVFVKKYKVVLNLVRNPKVPQDISLGLLHRLTDRDLQLINRDRSLSEFVRRAAQRILRGRKKY